MNHLHRLVTVAISAAFFIALPALAQTSGTVSNHAVAIGKGPGVTGFGSAAPGTAGKALVSTGASGDPSFGSVISDYLNYTAPYAAATTITQTAYNNNVVWATEFSGIDPTGVSDSGPGIRAAVAQLGPGAVLRFPAGSFLINSCSSNDGFGLSASAVKDNAISIIGTSSAVWSTGTVFVLGASFPDACSAIHLAGTSNIFGRQFRDFSIQPSTGVYGAGVGTHGIFVDGTSNDTYFEYHFTISNVQIGNMKLGQSFKTFAAGTNLGGGALNNATIENSILMSVNMKNVGDNIAFNRVTVGQSELRGDPGYVWDQVSGATSISICGGIIASANGSIIINGGVNPTIGCNLELESHIANSHGSMIDFAGATSTIKGGSMGTVTVSQNYATGTIYPVRVASAENVSIGPNNRLATSSAGGVHMLVTSAALNPSTNWNYCTTSGTVADCNVANASSTINSPKVNYGTANGTDPVNIGGFMTVGGLHLPGGTSGTFTLLPPLVAGTGLFRFSTGTNVDMLSTGGAGQVFKQTSLGGALTVGTLAASEVAGLGTGVATALGVNIGSAGAPVLFNGAGGTPSSITLTNANGTASSLTAGVANTFFITDNTTLNASVNIAWTSGTNSTLAPQTTSTKLTFNPSTGTLSSTSFAGSGAGLSSVPTTALTGALQAAQEPAHTGDVTNTAGSLALSLAAGSASVLNSGNLADARMPNTAWTTFTPTPTCGTATWTVTSARFKTWGKTTHWSMDLTISAIGSCTGGTFTWTTPNTPQSGAGGGGDESAVAGIPVGCKIVASSTTASCLIQTSLGLNHHYTVSGIYENQ